MIRQGRIVGSTKRYFQGFHPDDLSSETPPSLPDRTTRDLVSERTSRFARYAEESRKDVAGFVAKLSSIINEEIMLSADNEERAESGSM